MAKENKKEISFVEGPIFQSLILFAAMCASFSAGGPAYAKIVPCFWCLSIGFYTIMEY